MKVSQSVKAAILLVALVFLYFLVRGFFNSAAKDDEDAARARFAVVAETVEPDNWRAELVVRGRTEAKRKVVVRAETPGAVALTPAIEGAPVRKGDVLCQLEVNARKAQLDEARAAVAKARLDHNAAAKLSQDGFRSETAVAAAKAALDLALANRERAEIELEKTKITAPFDGVFDKRAVEIGDYLGVGDPCGTVIQQQPFLVAGAVSEKDVAKISVGDRGVARLAGGETVDGAVSFIAAAADPATRTFDVELEVPNKDGRLRDGVTAEFTIFARARQAYRIPRSALTLNDEGVVGVRTLSAENEVDFAPLQLLGETADGVWPAGLEGAVRIITRGQNYVATGQTVDAVSPEAARASAAQ